MMMSAMASQIISLTIACSTWQTKKTSKLRVPGLFAGNSPVTGEFPAQRASNAENVSIWWRLHDQVSLGVNRSSGRNDSLMQIPNDYDEPALEWLRACFIFIAIYIACNDTMEDKNFATYLANSWWFENPYNKMISLNRLHSICLP